MKHSDPVYCFADDTVVKDPPVWMLFFVYSLPYLFEVHYNATFLHHGVLLVVIHKVSKRVKPLAATYIVFTILLGPKINSSTTAGEVQRVFKSYVEVASVMNSVSHLCRH